MRIPPIVLPVAALALLTACGGGSSTSTTGSGPAPTTGVVPASPATASSAPPAGGSSTTAGSVLTGTVGKGDAFVIALVDSTGAKVKTLKAGTYQVKVKDLSKIHDFHLVGPGVDKATGVPDVVDVTWSVNLTAGSYTYKCDPHAAHMFGTFTVT